MRVLIVAGEESGDILGGAIVRELAKNKSLSLWGCGGRRMHAAGVEIFVSSEKLATIGFWEAAKNYRRLVKIINQIVAEAQRRGVRDAWLIDFPGFNMVLAKKLKAVGIQSTMVVSPTVWAWKYNRVFKIRERFARVLCLYDFEPAIYEKIGVEAHYIGHPITTETSLLKKRLEVQGNPLRKALKIKNRRVVAIMPGSRPSEIEHHAQRILDAVKEFQKKHTDFVFVLPAANEKMFSLLESYTLPPDTYLTALGAPYVLAEADAAIACSGTVTLECALFNVPHLIVYRSSAVSYSIFKMIVKTPYIGMANILAGREIARELLQYDFTATKVAAELAKILTDKPYAGRQRAELKKIAARLQAYQPAKQAARILTRTLQ